MNTHESYVSLETAKMLKEAGFDWPCIYGYDAKGKTCYPYDYRYTPWNDGTTLCCSQPTLAVAQRWLREVKGYSIYVIPGGYKYYVLDNNDSCGYGSTYTLNSTLKYEEALEAGIQKCLRILLEENDK